MSGLTAAVAITLKGTKYPASRARILESVKDITVDGWELSYFLEKSLERRSYSSLRQVMSNLEDWLEKQG